jgi:peroxiredoxin
VANPLTGDFDAVVQLSMPTLNRLLASMHQNHGNDAGLPTLPHRTEVSLPWNGDKPFGGSLAGIKGRAGVQIGAPTVALIANEPRAVNMSCWIRARYYPDPQTASLPEFIHGRIVARYEVKPITLSILFGASFILATASSEDANITFTDSGLNSADKEKVTGLIRDFLRTKGTAVLGLPPHISSGAVDFRGLIDGQGRQAVALPITLTDAAPGAGNLGRVFLEGGDFAIAISKEAILTLIQPYIEYFNKTPQPDFSFTRLGFHPTYKLSMTATVDWPNGGALTLDISGTAKTSHKISVKVNVFGYSVGVDVIKVFPDVDFGVRQSFTFHLNSSNQSISIEPSGKPNVYQLDLYNAVGAYYPPTKAEVETELTNRFVLGRDDALDVMNDKIDPPLAEQREQVRKLLRRIDDMAEITLASVPPDNDGLLLTGKINLSFRKDPHVDFSQLGDGSGYTAFDSWVPGGRIRHFHWTWWRAEDYDPLELSIPVHQTSPPLLVDRYVLQEQNLPGILLPSPAGGVGQTVEYAVLDPEAINHLHGDPQTGEWIPAEGQLCLEIGIEYVDHETGEVLGFGAAKGVLNPGIACHYRTALGNILLLLGGGWIPVERGIPLRIEPGWIDPLNTIVFQPVCQSQSVANLCEAGSELLLQALRQAERPDAPIMVVFALPMSGRGPSPALAARVRELRQKFPRRMGVAFVDRDAGQLSGLKLPTDDSRPGLRLLDPAGRLVWRHDGVADVTTIAAALHEHLVAGPPLRGLPGGLPQATVRPGKPPPDFTFEVGPGERIALRHLRGRRLAVIFVSKGNAAFEAVLNRLSADAAEIDEPRMVVIVQDGESSGTAATQRDLSFDWVAVADPKGVIARSYGITSRPTAVLVDWDGRVTTVKAMSTAIATSRQPSAGHGAGRA